MSEIRSAMQKIFQSYSCLRGKEPHEFTSLFWDCVVITSSDSEQRQGFELQIESKKSHRELPLVKYHVLADPPGVKIGSGGSTFEVLLFLKSIYGDALSSMRVLLIHAGGYSQRLASHSLCGKLFSCLPLAPSSDGAPWQLLDLKLATFLPFLKRMPPGIYVTASDDIVTYALGSGDWHFESPGLTALAHPSSLEVGSTHGVYVLAEKNNNVEGTETCWLDTCRTVLQKPSIEEMKKAGAIRICTKNQNEYVFSDSSFFFDHNVAALLLDALPVLNPLSCETDIYGDFLQPLGTKPNDNYINNNNHSKELTRVRKGLYDLLSGKPLNVLVLQESYFYHIGTIKELVFHWCQNKTIFDELGLQKQTFSLLKPCDKSTTVQGVLMQSNVHSDSVIGERSILECCDFNVPIVSKRAVISGCQLTQTQFESPLVIPDDVLLFTCALNVENEVKWSCGALHFDDDVKCCFDTCHCGDVVFLGRKLDRIYSIFGEKESRGLFEAAAKSCSLWNARLFPVAGTMQEAFLMTLEMVRSVLDGQTPSTTPLGFRLSLQDFLKNKSLKYMIDYREELRKSIVQPGD